MLKAKADICRAVAELMAEVAKLPDEIDDRIVIEDDRIESNAQNIRSMDVVWSAMCYIRDAKDAITVLLDHIESEDTNGQI